MISGNHKCAFYLLALAVMLLPQQSIQAQPSGRTNLNKGWKFCLEGGTSKTVDIPHDWGVEGPFEQVYPGETGKLAWWGNATYTKQIEIDGASLASGRRFYLDVDGAMSNATVTVNDKPAGGWPYGYASFRVDMTPSLAAGSNTIQIKLANPENSSRWYPGGGVYRNIWLVESAPVGIAHWGTCITTSKISKDEATVVVRTTLRNDTPSPVKGSVQTKLYYDGKEVASGVAETIIVEGAMCEQQLIVLKPALWTPDTPDLYTAVTTVHSEGTEDSIETLFGIREIAFTADGFFLNGEKTFMKGVCLHHDAGALGATWNTSAWIRRLNLLKNMGCNAIRTAHNPPAPEFLDLCDQMGFLVMDELTDTWTVPKKPNGYALLFEEWAHKDLIALIHRDRNHPSIVMWSIGNEVGEQGYADKWHIAQELTDICHLEDPTRPTTAGNDNLWAASQPYHTTIDVYGFNYKPHAYEQFHKDNPDQPYLGSETASCISTRGFYAFPVEEDKSGGAKDNQVSSYDLYAPGWASKPDYEWFYEDANPSCAGEFVWTGFDYLGEPTPYNFDWSVLTNFHDPESKAKAEAALKELSQTPPPSRSSYFGIIDLAGFPKDRYYLYQARWRKDLPMVHILPHWNWPGKEGTVVPIHVYTSGDSAELFVNGVSQGLKTKGEREYRLRWDDVVYQPGEVKVVAYKDGAVWASETVRTTGHAKKIDLSVEKGSGPTMVASHRSSNEPLQEFIAPEEIIFLDIAICDKKGAIVPDACPELNVKVKGKGVFVFADAGDPTSHIPFYSTSFKAFNGLCGIGVRATGNGRIKVKVSGKGLRRGYATLYVKDGKLVKTIIR